MRDARFGEIVETGLGPPLASGYQLQEMSLPGRTNESNFVPLKNLATVTKHFYGPLFRGRAKLDSRKGKKICSSVVTLSAAATNLYYIYTYMHQPGFCDDCSALISLLGAAYGLSREIYPRGFPQPFL